MKQVCTMNPTSAIEHSMREVGLVSLKEKQREAILAFLQERDIFVSLPTGYGKSVIYALLPLVFDKIRGESWIVELQYRVFECYIILVSNIHKRAGYPTVLLEP